MATVYIFQWPPEQSRALTYFETRSVPYGIFRLTDAAWRTVSPLSSRFARWLGAAPRTISPFIMRRCGGVLERSAGFWTRPDIWQTHRTKPNKWRFPNSLREFGVAPLHSDVWSDSRDESVELNWVWPWTLNEWMNKGRALPVLAPRPSVIYCTSPSVSTLQQFYTSNKR
jgi:hypothetical protein